ncbi:MAG TPA: hypothetical protein VEK76_09645 [Candidatus Binatia bacterium]|nr:hypothetical protein [Candidatus Binatia bacterium]
MSWLQRRTTVNARVEVIPEASGAGQATDKPCSAPGCDTADRVSCDYRDRRGSPCTTAWCREHVVVVGELHLCRRHAALVQALAPAEFRGELPAPDLDNRSPALAAYLGRALEPHVRRLLDEVVRPANGESVGEDPLILVANHTGGRRWGRGWKLYDNTGPLIRVGVEVDEASDPEFSVRLNGRVVLRCVPPWISARQPADDSAGEEKTRDRFFTILADEHIRPAVLDEERWVRRWERAPGRAART